VHECIIDQEALFEEGDIFDLTVSGTDVILKTIFVREKGLESSLRAI
jgi:hypothetical protein